MNVARQLYSIYIYIRDLQLYMNPLMDQVEHLFGPIAQVRVMYTTTLCMV